MLKTKGTAHLAWIAVFALLLAGFAVQPAPSAFTKRGTEVPSIFIPAPITPHHNLAGAEVASLADAFGPDSAWADSGGIPASGISGGAAVANKFVSAISAAGAVTMSQPSCANLTGAAASCGTNATELSSGTVPVAQMPALTGDCTTVSGAVATTCTKSNGNLFTSAAFGTALNLSAPPAIGGTTSSTGQFTKLCSGASPCTLPGQGGITADTILVTGNGSSYELTTSTSSTVNGLTLGPGNIASNLGVGPSALAGVTAGGTDNVAVGQNDLNHSGVGSDNTAVGSNALASTLFANATGDTAVGFFALNALQSGNNDVAIGFNAGRSINNSTLSVAVGANALLTQSNGGDENVALGADALNLVNGDHNLAVGGGACKSLTAGSSNVCIGVNNIDVPSATGSNQLDIQNIIYGTSIDGSVQTISSGNIGIGVKAPAHRLEVAGGTVPGVAGEIFYFTKFYSAAGTPIPACAASFAHGRGCVSDSTACTSGTTYTSGGATVCELWCDGTNWKESGSGC